LASQSHHNRRAYSQGVLLSVRSFNGNCGAESEDAGRPVNPEHHHNHGCIFWFKPIVLLPHQFMSLHLNLVF
jgi:hypothetical protein